MSLKHDLHRLLAEAGRLDLAQRAVGTVTFTDDGSTLYVHILAQPSWTRVARGRAFVLAWGEYGRTAMRPYGLPSLALRKALVREARLSLWDNVEAIARWLERR